MGTKSLSPIMILLLVALSGAARAADQLEAPMGFRSGQSIDEIRNLVEVRKSLTGEAGIVTILTQMAPKTTPDTELIQLDIDPRLGLGRVSWRSEDIDDDARGTKVRERYAELKEVLSQKYGRPANHMEEIGIKVYREPDEFFQCLKLDGCGMWTSIWDAKGGAGLMLKVEVTGRSSGRLSVMYEGPNWSAIIDRKDAGKKRQQKDSF